MHSKDLVKADLYRYFGDTSLLYFLRAWRIPGFRYMYVFRKTSSYTGNSVLGLIFRFWLRRLMLKYGYQISAGTKIGPGFYIGHFGIIVINRKAIIGSNCNVAHSITVGESYGGKNAGVPVIGDNVWIGTGAVLVGGIHIGNNVMIAPNAFVNIDVPQNHIAMGNPATIIERYNPTEHYIQNKAII